MLHGARWAGVTRSARVGSNSPIYGVPPDPARVLHFSDFPIVRDRKGVWVNVWALFGWVGVGLLVVTWWYVFRVLAVRSEQEASRRYRAEQMRRERSYSALERTPHNET